MDKESDSRNDVEGKTMAKWIDYNEDEQRALIANAASAKNIDPVAVEKDWWVTASFMLFSFMLFSIPA